MRTHMRAQPENSAEKRMGAVFCQGDGAFWIIWRRFDAGKAFTYGPQIGLVHQTVA